MVGHEGGASLTRINDMTCNWYVEEEEVTSNGKDVILPVHQYVLKNGHYLKFVGQPFFFTFKVVCWLIIEYAFLYYC